MGLLANLFAERTEGLKADASFFCCSCGFDVGGVFESAEGFGLLFLDEAPFADGIKNEALDFAVKNPVFVGDDADEFRGHGAFGTGAGCKDGFRKRFKRNHGRIVGEKISHVNNGVG